jgi:hypothetical protein
MTADAACRTVCGMHGCKLAGMAMVTVALLAPGGTAQAEVTVKGTGEPAFTSSANNTQWVEWSNNGGYRIEFNHHVNGGNAVVDGPYQVGRTGSTAVNWTGIRGVSVPLAEGSTYAICGFGRWDDGTGTYFPDFSTSCGDADRRGLRASTTIDRTAPTVTAQLAGGAAAVKDPALALRIGFTDNLAGPFPANFLCVQAGSDGGPLCDSAQGHKYVEQPACSQPGTRGKATTFDCVVHAGATPDGQVAVCVMGADASIPDNPTSDDQRASSTSANRSAPACDTVLLDRAAPSLTAAAQPGTTVTAGEPVAFAATASDAVSGLSGQYAWDFADGTAPAAGQAVSHVFAKAGTYPVEVGTTDAAGNAATATVTVTVEARPVPSPTPSPSPSPGPSPSPDPSPSPGPGPDRATVTVSAPKRVALTGGRARVPVAVTVPVAGQVRASLVRRGRIVAQGARRVTAAGTASLALRVPRGARAGRHALQVTFAPVGGRPVLRSRPVRLAGATASRTRRTLAAVATARPVVVGAGLGPVLPDGRYRGPAGRRVVVDR